MSCCIDTIGGAPPSGATPMPLQGAIYQGLDAAAATGSTDFTVINFNGSSTQVGTVPLANWITRTDSPTLGTRFTILQPGVYACLLYTPLAQGFSFQGGVTFNATVAQRQGTFEPFDPEVYASNFKFATTIQGGLQTQAHIIVRSSDISGGTNIIRAQAGDTLGNAPLGGIWIDEENVALRVFLTNNNVE